MLEEPNIGLAAGGLQTGTASSTSTASTATTMAANAYADDPLAPSSRPAGLTYGGAGETVSD